MKKQSTGRVSLPIAKLTATLGLAITLTFNACEEKGGGGIKTVKIGSQVWMAENLNYEAEGSICYDNKPDNCKKYGKLYNWETAKSACPKGWKLPSKAEWEALLTAVGGKETAGKLLKATSGWNDNGNGTDKFGFSALPSGLVSPDGFADVGNSGNWWSSSKDDSGNPYFCSIINSREDFIYGSEDQGSSYSVRCLQN